MKRAFVPPTSDQALWVAINDRTIAMSFLVALVGGLTGAVLNDWLTRRRGVKRASSVALELPDRDAGYSAEWEVEGPVLLSAQDARITLTPN
jgi:hypothetical protein